MNDHTRGLLALAAFGVGLYLLFRKSGGGCKPLVTTPGQSVLLVGDSLAVGLDRPLGALAVSAGTTFQAVSKSGTTMRYWLGGPLNAAMAQSRPHLVLVSLGTNDSKGLISSADAQAQVATLAGQVRQSGAAFGWILPPGLPFPELVAAHVRKAGIPAFESSRLVIPQGDGIHPTGAGYQTWAAAIWRWATCASGG